MAGVGLSQIIATTADELRSVQKQVTDPKAIMQFRGCEIELSVTAKVEGGGGLKFWLVDASAKAAKENVSKIKIAFAPIPGRDVYTIK